MKPVIRLFLCLFLGGHIMEPMMAQSPSNSQPASGPRMAVAQALHDFGKIKASSTVRHDFVVLNSGSETLEITSVVPACGCTAADEWDRRIEPGKTGRIPIQFNPANFDGNITKTISVTSNDRAQPNQTLEIRAVIWRPVDIKPPRLHFTPVEGDPASETKQVHIINNLDEPLRLELLADELPPFRAKLQAVKEGHQFVLDVTHVGPATKIAQSRTFELKTSSTETPVIQVSVYAVPQAAITLVPTAISVPAKVESKFEHTQMVLNNSARTFTVTGASVNGPGVTAEISELRPGKLFGVKLQFPAGYEPQSGQQLEIRTSDASLPILHVPIMARPTTPTPVPAPVPASVDK